MRTNDPPAVFTVNELSAHLRISRTKIYELFASGDLVPVKLAGRTLVRRIDADALLEKAASQAALARL